MVAHLLRLRFRLLFNGFRRSTWQLVGAVIGALYGLGLLAGIVVAMVGLSFADAEWGRAVAVLAGALLVLGWLVVPLLLRGFDQSLSVAKLRSFPIPPQRLLVALLVVGLLGVPGLVTLFASLSTTLSWIGEPVAMLAAPFAALLGALTCVTASRALESVGASLASGRRYREVMGVVVFVPVLLLGPLIAVVGGSVASIVDDLPSIAETVSWTPLGAVWSIPGDLALGDGGAALAKTGIALATLGVLLLLWRRALAVSLVAAPPSSGGSSRAKGLGAFGLFPATPTGAVAARTAVYWLRDPRYGGSLVALPVLVVLGVFLSVTGSDWFLVALGPLFGAVLGITLCAEISYDGTAFAAHLSTGLDGAADRAGRVLTLGLFSVPAVVLATVVPLVLLGRGADVPALLGIALGLLLTGFGVSSVASTRFLMPVPAAGESPFKTPPGSTFKSQLGMYAAWAIVFALSAPEIALGVAAVVTGELWLGLAALVLGIVLGGVLCVVGVRRGGAMLDRRGPELLASLRRTQGA
ncbi:transporter [Frigoribacterium salinisoli]